MDETPGRTRGSGRRRHWKLPDMISGVRHRFRDKMQQRSKSPDNELYLRDSLDSDAASSSNLSNSTNMAMYNNRYNGGGATLPRASSMMSTDYGFNPLEWGGVGFPSNPGTPGTPIDLTSSGVSNQRQVPRPPPHASADMNNRPLRQSELHRGASSSSQQQRPSSRLPSSANNTLNRSNNTSSYEASLTTSGDYDFTSPPPAATTYPSYQRGGVVGRAASVSVLNQPSSPLQPNPSSLGRGNKSVRFGENRISVFLQDSTQALEECVRLALSYAEESKARADYHSDSEAVSLTRRLQRDPTIPEAKDVNRTRSFYSDSEEPRPSESHLRDPSSVPGSLRRDREGSQRVPPTPTSTTSAGYQQKSFGQAVSSLDRLERLDRARAEARSRKKRSAQINEIFSFIDKVLSGCDSGCSDDGCPLAREALRARHGDQGGCGIQPHHHPARQQVGASSSSSFNPASFPNTNSCHTPASSSYSQRTKKRRDGSDESIAGHNSSRSNTRGGFESDSDCDTSGASNCSTLVRGRGRPQRGRLRDAEDEVEKRDHLWNKDKTRTTEDVFAQIIICSELNKQRLGMPRYGHLHQKISQTVCNAIFLCKVDIILVQLAKLLIS